MAEYHRVTVQDPPHPILVEALDQLWGAREPGQALDLGCGSGRDTRELLKRGFEVLAVDASPEGLELLSAAVGEGESSRLKTRLARFEEGLQFRRESFDLINASFSLPFCAPGSFPEFWENVRQALRAGGVFCGTFFGPNDSWNGVRPLTFHTRGQVKELFFPGFDPLLIKEQEIDGPTRMGDLKHWHVIHVAARRVGLDAETATVPGTGEE